MALVLLRHGLSAWNTRGLFTGWVDVPLCEKGIEESLEAGRQLANFPLDVVYTSALVRAQMTAFLALSLHKGGKVPCLIPQKASQETKVFSEEAKADLLPVFAARELNERCYGALQGMNKDEMRKKFGPEQVQVWRRSFEGAPPEGESLADTARRTLPYFEGVILPQLKAGKSVLIAAHGNSLRSIVMELEQLSKEAVVSLEIPTGVPLLYRMQEGRWKKDRLTA
jgi:2,3-bisphosphoglycerate-dependent phosphoglycerate mutase